MKDIAVGFRVDEELYKRFKINCTLKQKKMKNVFADLIVGYLESHKEKRKRNATYR